MIDDLKRPNVKFLYHYASAENLGRVEPILLRNKLYFPRAEQLDDLSEARIPLSAPTETEFLTYLRALHVSYYPGLTKQQYNKDMQGMYEAYQQDGMNKILGRIGDAAYEVNRAIRIYSMSKRYDNFSMWAKYANEHKGYCLEFKNTGVFSRAREVKYTAEKPSYNPLKLDKLNPDFLFTKSTEWSTQEEVRIVISSKQAHPVIFEPSLLNRIILGHKMKQKDKAQIIKWAKGRYKVVQASYDSLNDKLNLVEID